MTPEEIKALKDKGIKFLKDLFTQDQITALNAQLAPPVIPAPSAAKEFKTADGVSVFVTGVDTDGLIDPTKCKAFSDAAATMPMADGEYTFADGSSITIAGGIITEVESAAGAATEPPNPMADMAIKMAAQEKSFSVKLADQKKAFDEEIKKLQNINQSNAAIMIKMMDQPIYTAEPTKTKEYKDMSAAEKYNHDNPISK